MMGKAALLLAGAVLAWGIGPLLDKTGLKSGVDPVAALTVRTCAALVATVLMLLVNQRIPAVTGMSAQTAGFLAAGGILTALVGNWFYFSALQTMDASLVVAITSTYPAVTILLSWIFLNERLAPRQWFALSLIGLGVFLLEWFSRPENAA